VPARAHLGEGVMGRIFLIVFLLGLVAIGAGVLVLGAFPPEPKTQPIQKVLPNDHFKTG
jgi:hypothetical protein